MKEQILHVRMKSIMGNREPNNNPIYDLQIVDGPIHKKVIFKTSFDPYIGYIKPYSKFVTYFKVKVLNDPFYKKGYWIQFRYPRSGGTLISYFAPYLNNGFKQEWEICDE